MIHIYDTCLDTLRQLLPLRFLSETYITLLLRPDRHIEAYTICGAVYNICTLYVVRCTKGYRCVHKYTGVHLTVHVDRGGYAVGILPIHTFTHV